MTTKYISLDVEASGRVPGIYSLLSIGACVVGEQDKQFYRELKPISPNFDIEAMKIGCLGLKCLELFKNYKDYNPKSETFNPSRVLGALSVYGDRPKTVMKELNNWTLNVSAGCEPVLLTDVQPFDGSFINWYFEKFLSNSENPFGYKGLNIDILYRGLTGNINSNLRDLGLIDDRKTPHNALDDAVFQAKLAEKVFELMKVV
ncbi:hypothetical protein COV11_00015 [Candidatus Woesearchaeota archaeon CG10_big_fil_rev_8_21_14_0_10_30_7]|nr:MAG: hypothetical protein COV11_00015 [Candidatus Woesearchaeota archaeon CG10_big_fil_rev_8_21_14_0_10_30_7]